MNRFRSMPAFPSLLMLITLGAASLVTTSPWIIWAAWGVMAAGSVYLTWASSSE